MVSNRSVNGGVVMLGLLALLSASFGVPSAKAMEPVEIYREKAPSVVLIFAKIDANTRSGGTGFFINDKGTVVTNAHVVIGQDGSPMQEISVFIKPAKVTGDFQEDLQDRHAAHVVKFDRPLDIAVLSVDGITSVPAVGFGNSDDVEVGQKVVAIGHPEQGGLWTLTSGAISTRLKNLSNVKGKDMFQSDASINHGNSGGPLLDSNGQLIGMNSSTSRKSADGTAIVGINFALQSNVIMRWLKQNNIGATAAPVQVAQNNPPPQPKQHVKPTENTAKVEAPPPAQSKPQIVTPPKPFKWNDLEATIKEMEELMGEMRGKIRDKFGE
ncbi:MAG: trypsin-like peptidase domain-containing protein [Nitrospinae bacterium]|nr:trypsin-like peptidase domain-containing protein [Nitrospinota bacterium]